MVDLGMLVYSALDRRPPSSLPGRRARRHGVYTHHTCGPPPEKETTVSVPPRASPPAYACRLRVSVQREYIERVPVGLSVSPLALLLSLFALSLSISCSLSFSRYGRTGPYVLWIRTRRFPLPYPRFSCSLGLADLRMTQPSASHPAPVDRLA